MEVQGTDYWKVKSVPPPDPLWHHYSVSYIIFFLTPSLMRSMLMTIKNIETLQFDSSLPGVSAEKNWIADIPSCYASHQMITWGS